MENNEFEKSFFKKAQEHERSARKHKQTSILSLIAFIIGIPLMFISSHFIKKYAPGWEITVLETGLIVYVIAFFILTAFLPIGKISEEKKSKLLAEFLETEMKRLEEDLENKKETLALLVNKKIQAAEDLENCKDELDSLKRMKE